MSNLFSLATYRSVKKLSTSTSTRVADPHLISSLNGMPASEGEYKRDSGYKKKAS